ncbi:hypothetical protein MNBD_GAMMA05-1851 [hydrothermal vent metagenome]|uniref:Uncharacterized protein n=1 Tax=hydrothermal vent metagenome TaxID=652676 RepID=A0A3B0XFW7_9ZZZZ
MSLLLDALKKAADDKKKISNAELVETAGKGEPVRAGDKKVEEELSIEVEIPHPEPDDEYKENKSGEPELTLDNEVLSPNNPLDSTRQDSKTEKFVISDDGLSLLIHKTNNDIKQNKKLVLVSIIAAIILILVGGGVFYYSEMQAEIASLERKHQIAMQSMRSKTNTGRIPKSSNIIRNLVSDADLNNKVKFAKDHMADENVVAKKIPQTSVPVKRLNNTSSILSIQKTNKVDSVGALLDDAWLSYDNGQYESAKKMYAKVLSIEGNNRDALLGLGAISVLQKDNVRARKIYLTLLELDPRDPIATAAISGLHSNAGSLDSDENHLLSMLQKNSEAPHLNFSLANIYAQKNKWSSAQQYYFKAWKLDSDNADYIFNLAVSLDQLDKSQQAIKFYKNSLLKAKNKQVRFSREAAQKRINELLEL